MKKYICVCLAVLLCLSFSSTMFITKAEQESNLVNDSADNDKKLSSEDFIKVSEQEGMVLWVNTKTAEIVLEDTSLGFKWSSNPIYTVSDPTTSEDTKILMQSQIKVSFLDEIRNIVTVGSFSHSVNSNTYEIRTIKENGSVVGVKITYDFQQTAQRFKIPIEVKLTKGYLEASILYDEIEEYGTSVICNIDLLPYFGASTSKTDGYMFIPDGSGAIMKFSDNYREASDYNEPVYGEDASVNLMKKSISPTESIRMPVFGIKHGNASFLAVIDQGDALASIYASSNSRVSSFSSVNASFAYRESDSAGLADKDSMKRIVRMADKQKASVSPKIRYYFLHGEDSNYSGMARKYRSYLIEKYGLKKKTGKASPLLLEMFGRTEKRSHFVGIPIKKPVVATSFEQASDMIVQLKQQGVSNVTSVLYGFQDGGYQNKLLTKQKFDSKVGGKKGYKSFLDAAKDSPVYVSYDLIRNYEDVSSWFKKEKYIRSLNGLTVTRQRGNLSSGAWKDSQQWLISSGDHLVKQVDKLLNTLEKDDNAGVVYQNMGEELYNNFSPKAGEDRQQMLQNYQDILKNTSEKAGRVAAESGNIYMINNASMLYEIPLNSSSFHIVSQSIPFYSMVLHGYVELASENLNADGDEQIWLRCLEAGVTPTYRVTNCDSNEMVETKLNFLYNTKFDDLKQTMCEKANSFSEMQKDLQDKCITSHLQDGSLSIMTYENNAKIIVNFGDEEQNYQGQKIQSKSAIRIN